MTTPSDRSRPADGRGTDPLDGTGSTHRDGATLGDGRNQDARVEDRTRDDRLTTDDRSHRGGLATREDDGATRAEETRDRGRDTRASHDHPMQEAFLGTDSVQRTRTNASWGAIFAGVATFLALSLVLNIATAAMGLQGVDGTAAGIWSIVTVGIALAAGGFVAGALAVRAGLLHGFLTWATSMLSVLVLAGWLGTGLLGAAGDIAGGAAQTAGQGTTITAEDITAGMQDPETQQQLEQAQQEVQQALDDAQRTIADQTDNIAEGTWWAFAGVLIGGLLAAFAGMAGSRSVINREDEVATGRTGARR